ncbi:uncharacterized protein [Eurosta solidaginis]
MSMQPNKQKYRLVSSAPTNSTRERHIHFREIRSDEPKRRCEDEECKTWPTMRREDTNESLEPSYTSHILSSSSYSTLNTPPDATLAPNQSFYRLPEDLLARGDFIAYQSGNVTDFFNNTYNQRPQRISEICLVNDHYILVKVPEIRKDRDLHMEPIMEEESSTITAAGDRQARREFFRCFPCQRNRRILPAASLTTMRSAESFDSGNANKTRSLLKCPLAHCWRLNEKPEVFEGHTKLFGRFWKQKLPGQVITIQPSKADVVGALDLRLKSERHSQVTVPAVKLSNNQIDAEVFGTPLHSPNKLEPHTVIRAPLQTSLHEIVTLEQHTAWMNDETSYIAKDKPPSFSDNKEKKKIKRRSAIFNWLFKRPRGSKPKSKIHAVVYKTYFVRWKKPPDEPCPHCGHNRNDAATNAAASCKWRRCHSATF